MTRVLKDLQPRLSPKDNGGGNGKTGHGKPAEPEIYDVTGPEAVPGHPGMIKSEYTEKRPGEKPHRIRDIDIISPSGTISSLPPEDLGEVDEKPAMPSSTSSTTRRSFSVPSVFEGTGPKRPGESQADFEARMRRQGYDPDTGKPLQHD